ncbi:autotransporter-associated beta strand repeat-containing protein [Paraflavisolibacter sp. H34]|uniref:autotransporter-associated beta strand repeat-containing protein n=1 Tax=Huijunlia imazamoxiresistens TaxID=3127457 RepID=UPI0030183C33
MRKLYPGRGKPIALLTLALSLFSAQQAQAQLPAFPGAEGFGKYATGGRYGSVYRVTNLNNSGAGSLRDAVSAPNRIVVFDVAGVIRITERLIVSANIYLAGQTAPGEGITVYGNGWSFSNAHNTICRYMKIRMGAVGSSGVDANGLASGHDIIFDHCSVSWGRDENFSINSSTAQNITIQNSIISQGLLTHSAGGLMQCDGGITLYRNLYADNGTRNNKVKGVNQYVNNIVYNWSAGAYIMGGESSGNSYVNVTNNCFIQGPTDGVRPMSLGNSLFHIYAADNLYDNNRDGVFNPYTLPQSEYEGPPDFQATPYNYPALPTVPAKDLVADLLPTVGASLPYRDYADYYVVNEVKSLGKKGELIANESSLPFGVPTTWNLWAGTARTDSDQDGMPDAWEATHGTNPSVADAMVVTPSGYTNIETYINGLTAAASQEYLRTPMKLKVESATQNSVLLTWLDYTEKEQGYIIEKKVDGSFVQIGTTGVNQNTFEVTGMQPEQTDIFRVKAFNGSLQSAYSNELAAKSKPVEVPVLDPATFAPGLTWTGALNGTWDKSTQNWKTADNSPAVYTDGSSLHFPEAGPSGQTISLAEQLAPGDLLVNSGGNYTFSGTGFIAGNKSVNKSGAGTLALGAANTYTGATVVHEGTIEFSKLANGGAASSLGASPNYGFNWVWKGGSWKYTGPTVGTDRNAVLDATTEFNVSNSASTVTFNGVLTGEGGLVKSGPGKLVLKNANPYAGETIINGGTLEVSPVSSATLAQDIIDNNQGIGTSNVLRLHNGTYKTSNGSGEIYENYPLQLYVDDSTVNGFEPFRNANLSMTVHGNGTLNYTIPYLRELVQGDWSDFTGTLVANGVNTADTYSLLLIDNGTGFPANRIVTTGNTKIASWQNNNTLYIGGLSGNAGTWLSTGGTKSPSFGEGFTTYVVGAAGTDETFNGVINNHLYGNAADGSGTTTIVKEGSGLWRLTGNNTYVGTTTVTDGKLIVNGAHSGPGKITVEEGAILAGKGSLAGAVDVWGTLEPGDSSRSTFTLKDKLTLQATALTSVDINKTANSWDKLAVTGNIAYGGTLKINFTGTPVSGDTYKIFSTTAAVTGTITGFEPATPAPGLLWVFKPATGELQVQAPNYVEAPASLHLDAAIAPGGGASNISVSWDDLSDNEDYFILERSTDSINFADVAHPAANTTTYSDNGLQGGMRYYYRIKAHSSLSASNYSRVVGVTTPAADILPTVTATPSPANNATNVFLNGRSIDLDWTGNYADTYQVYLGTSPSALTKVAEVAATAGGYTLPALEPNTAYYWRIDAQNGNGTTTGTTWNFKTANVPVTVAGDFRSAATGNWGTTSVATNIWETFDGTSWKATTAIPSSSTNTVTIRFGHTVRLNATTNVNNVVVESGGTLVSGTDGSSTTVTNRNLRVVGSINNFGTVGSSTTSTNRINFEGTRTNGTTYITGTSTYYLNTFTMNSGVQDVEVIIDADLNLASYMRAFGSTGTAAQNDDDVTLTISEGKTVTITGSNSYLHSGSTPTNNTIVEFGRYTYNINGTLDMRSTGTSCIVAHSTLANSNITINVNGSWLTGNAMRFASTSATAGTMNANIGPNGVVDAGIRATGSNTPTNMVFNNATSGQIFYNISGNGVLKNKVGTSEVLFPIGSGNTYSPVKLTNSATMDIAVGVKTGLSYPVGDASKVVNKQFSVTPAGSVSNLAVSLGWVTANQGSGFNPAGAVALGRYNGNQTWSEAAAAISGSGTVSIPYFARVSGNTQTGTFVVSQAGIASPTVTAITRQAPATENTSDSLLTYRVQFSENVQDVDVSDFALTPGGSITGTVASVTPVSGAAYDVVVNSISGEGTLRLDIKGTGITDFWSNALAAGFTAGESYTREKREQTITFAALDTQKVGDADVPLTATATSGLAISYSSSNPEVAVVSGATLRILGAGTTTITARQEGDNFYHGAAALVRELTVEKRDQVISFAPLGEKAYGAADFDAGATASSNLGIVYTSSNTDVATIVNGQVHIRGLGTTLIAAAQEGNYMYKSAPTMVQSLTVSDKTAPLQPQALTVTKTADGKVGLMWQATTDDIGVAGYFVFLNGKQLNEQPLTTTSFITDAPAGSLVYAYTVIAADAAGNLSSESATALFANSNGGGSANSSLETMKVFPNPTDGNFKVRLNSRETGTVVIGIYNSNGVLIQAVSEGKSGDVYQREFKLQGVPKGMYMVRVAVGSFVQTSMVLIQ